MSDEQKSECHRLRKAAKERKQNARSVNAVSREDFDELKRSIYSLGAKLSDTDVPMRDASRSRSRDHSSSSRHRSTSRHKFSPTSGTRHDG